MTDAGMREGSLANPKPVVSAHRERRLDTPAAVVSAGSSHAGKRDRAALAAHYESAVFEYGFASLCKMTLPDDLSGKTVLDIGCRRGKGVFKLSDRVGEQGFVVGIDWVPAFIEEARRRADRAWRDSGLSKSNREFHVAYPEDLRAAGIEDESMDVVFANCSINLAYDFEAAYREIFRVLVPGGLFINETVIADGPREPSVVKRARAIGNGVQAAPSRAFFEGMLNEIGFKRAIYQAMHEVSPSDGFEAGYTVETVDSDEKARFFAGVVHVLKPSDHASRH